MKIGSCFSEAGKIPAEKGLSFYPFIPLPHHGYRSFTSVQDDALTSYTRIMESAVRRSCGARSAIEVLACRNDLNRKRIVSLQLTAHS
jgi:hypothetical protein